MVTWPWTSIGASLYRSTCVALSYTFHSHKYIRGRLARHSAAPAQLKARVRCRSHHCAFTVVTIVTIDQVLAGSATLLAPLDSIDYHKDNGIY